MSIAGLLDAVVGRGLFGRNAPVCELHVALRLVHFEHAVYQAHQLFVHYRKHHALLLHTQLFEPLSSIPNDLLVSLIRVGLLEDALELLE